MNGDVMTLNVINDEAETPPEEQEEADHAILGNVFREHPALSRSFISLNLPAKIKMISNSKATNNNEYLEANQRRKSLTSQCMNKSLQSLTSSSLNLNRNQHLDGAAVLHSVSKKSAKYASNELMEHMAVYKKKYAGRFRNAAHAHSNTELTSSNVTHHHSIIPTVKTVGFNIHDGVPNISRHIRAKCHEPTKKEKRRMAMEAEAAEKDKIRKERAIALAVAAHEETLLADGTLQYGHDDLFWSDDENEYTDEFSDEDDDIQVEFNEQKQQRQQINELNYAKSSKKGNTEHLKRKSQAFREMETVSFIRNLFDNWTHESRGSFVNLIVQKSCGVILRNLITALEPVFHRDYTMAARGNEYPYSVFLPKRRGIMRGTKRHPVYSRSFITTPRSVLHSRVGSHNSRRMWPAVFSDTRRRGSVSSGPRSSISSQGSSIGYYSASNNIHKVTFPHDSSHPVRDIIRDINVNRLCGSPKFPSNVDIDHEDSEAIEHRITIQHREQLSYIRDWFDMLSPKYLNRAIIQCIKFITPDLLSILGRRLEAKASRNFISELPHKTAVHILQFLDPVSVCRAACVSKHWNHICHYDDMLWFYMCKAKGWANGDYDPRKTSRLLSRKAAGPKELSTSRLPKKTRTKLVSKPSFIKGSDIVPHVLPKLATTGNPTLSAADAMAVAASTMSSTVMSTTIESTPQISSQPIKPEINATATSSRASIRKGEHRGDDVGNGLGDPEKPDNITWKQLFRDRYREVRLLAKARYRGQRLEGHNSRVIVVRFGDNRIVSGSVDRSIRLWDMVTGMCMRKLQGHTGGVWCIKFDKVKIISGSWDTTVRVWDIFTGELLYTLRGHKDTVVCLDYNSEQLVTGSFDGTIRIWDISTYLCVRIIPAHVGAVYGIEMDGILCLSCGSDSRVALWNTTTANMVTSYRGHNQPVMACQMNTYYVVTASWDTIRVYSRETEECLHVMVGHMGRVEALWLRGTRIVSGARDRLIKEWDLVTGRCIRTFRGHSAPVTCVQFDDRHIISSSEDHSIQVWDVTPKPETLANADAARRERHGRNQRRAIVNLGSNRGRNNIDVKVQQHLKHNIQ